MAWWLTSHTHVGILQRVQPYRSTATAHRHRYASCSSRIHARIPAQYWNSEASRALSISGDIDDDEPTLPQAGAGEEAG